MTNKDSKHYAIRLSYFLTKYSNQADIDSEIGEDGVFREFESSSDDGIITEWASTGEFTFMDYPEANYSVKGVAELLTKRIWKGNRGYCSVSMEIRELGPINAFHFEEKEFETICSEDSGFAKELDEDTV